MSVALQTGDFYTELVEEYQEKGCQDSFHKLYEHTYGFIKTVLTGTYKRVKNKGVTFDELEQEAFLALWETAKSFDGTKGSNYIAYLTMHIKWKISDNLLKPKRTKQHQIDEGDLRLEHTLSTSEELGEDSTLLDTELQSITQSQMSGKEREDIMEKVEKLLAGFEKEANETHFIMMKTIFKVIQAKPSATKREINNVMYGVFDDRQKNTVRSQKRRAVDNFKEYCARQEESVNLSKYI